MQAIWRPEQRSRRIGLAALGPAWSKRAVLLGTAERLGPHQVVNSRLHGRPLTLLVEPARLGASYGCGPRDAVHLLGLLPKPDLDGLDLVVFRQPSRRVEIPDPPFGRCLFRADFGRHKGSAILLEAADLAAQRGGSKGPRATERSLRDSLLYHALPREVGRWVDWQKRVLRPARKAGGRPRSELEARYFARSAAERDALAARYAARQGTRLRAAGLIPFQPFD